MQGPDEVMGCMLVAMIILAVFALLQFFVETYL